MDPVGGGVAVPPPVRGAQARAALTMMTVVDVILLYQGSTDDVFRRLLGFDRTAAESPDGGAHA